MYTYGDCVVYRKTKHKSRPARRATKVHPTPKGETYTYSIDKYCRVVDVDRDGQVTLLTRRSGHITVDVNNPRLRRARWWERWLRAKLFPAWPPPGADTQTDRNAGQP